MDDYSFCKFSILPNMNKVIWEITNECNYTCEYCVFSSTGKKPRGELSFEKVIETLNELKSNGFNYIKFTGGEPFIRSDFIDILKEAKSLGFNYDISTNASFITEEISKQLSLLDLNFIHVSLDGYDLFSHEIVRGKKSFSKTMIGLKHLIKYNDNIRLGCVIHSNNENHLQKVANLANELMVREIIFSLMAPIGRMEKNSPSLATKSAEQLLKEINLLKTTKTKINHNLSSDIKPMTFKSQINNNSCPGGTKFLFIDSIGIVSPCTWITDMFPQYHILSLHNNTLQNILNSNLFKGFNKDKKDYKGQCFIYTHKPQNLFNQLYSFATENIDFINYLPINENIHSKALTITGSGDQALLLVQKGFINITNIDVNYLAKYYGELKIAAVSMLSFNEFIDFFKNEERALSYQVYKKLSSKISIESEKFWNQQYMHNNYNGKSIRNSSLFNLKHDDWDIKLNNIPYLNSEEQYNKIKKLLNENNIQFKFITDDYQNIQLNDVYDVILLSNIADYSHKMYKNNNIDYIKKFKTNFVEKSLGLLNKEGLLMFAYIYDYENINHSSTRNKINNKLIRKMYFNEFKYQEFIIKSAIKNINNDIICYIKKD